MENIYEMAGGALNRYRLDIPSCPSPLDVEDFSGREGLSVLYDYSVTFTCSDKNLSPDQFLNKPATFRMAGGLLTALTEQKIVHGMVTFFQRLGGPGQIPGHYRTFPETAG